MSTTNNFIPARNQDASAVIRGFRYQIDHTLLRWLSLSDDEHLELECGEDIDLIGRALNDADVDGCERRLEQIKLRSAKLSLRSESALEVLANAVSHLLVNRSLTLSFCYTTNAISTRERPCPFPNKVSGIAVWKQLQSATLPSQFQTQAIESLRQFLSAAAKPKKVLAETWLQFIAFIRSRTEAEMLSFIRAFEWICGAPEVGDLSDRVRNEVRKRIGDQTERVDEIYDRVFLYVFRLLTQPSVKRLTKASLESELTTPTFSDSDRTILGRLQSRCDDLEERVGSIEESVAGITGDVQRIAQQHGVIVGTITAVGLVTVDPPILVDSLSARSQTVADLAGHLAGRVWLALYGLADTGKTHLASLISRERGRRSGWIRFQDAMPQEHALMILRESMLQIGAAAGTGTLEGSLSWPRVLDSLGSGCCLVLDNVPNIIGMPILGQQLSFLASACRNSNVVVVSTSQFRLPSNVTVGFGDSLLEVPIPRFSDFEARDVLVSHGAPATAISKNGVRFINNLSSGHPLLLTLAAKFLKQRGWRLDDSEFTSLLRGDHSLHVADEVLLRVCQSLDSPQRELLYRLTIAIGNITDSDAMKLAAVDVAIERPKERLVELIGAWVQRDTTYNLTVSPLVKSLGKDNLAPETLVSCHRVLGNCILQKPMTPWDAEIAVLHFVQAREFNRAGVLWMSLLNQVRVRKVAPELKSVLSLWYDLPLPVEMNLTLRVIIRATQFWVLPKYDKPIEPVLKDLDYLMEQIGPSEAHAAHVVGSLASAFLASVDFFRAARYLRKSIEILRLGTVDRSELLLPRGKNHVELLWTLIIHIKTRADLQVWLESFDSLTLEEREVVMRSSDAVSGCCVLADRLMIVEIGRPASQQKWTRVLTDLHWLRQAAAQLKWGHLEAAARKTIVNVQGEFLETPDACIEDVREYIAGVSVSPSDAGLVAGMLGKVLAGRSQLRESLPWLKFAIASPESGLIHDRMMTLLAAARSVAAENEDEAVRYTEEAARLARESKDIPDIEAVKVIGEWAIALAGMSQTREASLRAFPAWNEAAARMLSIRTRDRTWKDIFVVFCHVNSYLIHLADNGYAPTHAADGSAFAAPRQGMFFRFHPQRADLFRDESIPTVMWLMSQYAWKYGDETLANLWMRRAADEIDGMEPTYLTVTIARDLIPDLLRASKFDDVISVGLRSAQVMVTHNERASMAKEVIDLSASFEDFVAGMSPTAQSLAERFAIIAGVIPALLHLMRVSLVDQDKAADDARQIAAICRQEAASASDKKLWTGSADVLDAVANNANEQDCLQLANSFPAAEYAEIRVMGYLASAMTSNCESAFQAQLACIEKLLGWYPVDTAIYNELLLPYVQSFWTTTFQRSRFQFRSPSLIESQLAIAISSEPKHRVRAILLALLPSFRATGLEDAVAALNRS